LSGNNIGDRNGLLPKEFRIFISYAREDENKAKRLYNDLKNSGLPIKPWIDKEDLFPGQDFDLEIKKAIKQSTFFIPLFSSVSVEKRGYIQREFRLAVDTLQEIPPGDIFVIPVKLDECEIPYDELKRYTYQELFPSWYTSLERILKSIQMSIEKKFNKYSSTLTDNNQNRQLQENIDQHLTKQKVSPISKEEVEQEQVQNEKPIIQSSLRFIGEKSFFLGREEYINEKIKNALKEPGSRVSLVGVGGSGKSQLAFKALHQYFEKDRIIDLVIPVYLSAISSLSTTTTAAAARNISTSFDNISQSNASTTLIISITFKKFLNDIGFYLIKKNILSLSEQAFDQLDIENAKSEVYEVLSSKKYPILYCDNFESLSSMVEDRERNDQEINSIFNFLNNELPSNTSILITSRNRKNFLSEYLIDLEGLSIEEGIDLFIKHASVYQHHLKDKNNNIMQDLLKTIVTKTGGHPLSIEILAKTYKGEGSKELEEISQTLGKERKNPVESEERLRSLNNSFKFSIDKLAHYNKELLPALTIFHSAFPSNAIEKIFGLQNKDVLRELYDKSLLTRIEADQYGPISDDRFWLYSLHPALRNYLEDKYKDDIVNIHRERIPFFCKYYKELLQETYDAWGTSNHRNFIRRFELMAKSNDNDFNRAIKFAIMNSKENEDSEIKIIGSDIASYFGLIYQNLGYFDQSLLYHMESLEVDEELKDRVRISYDYTNIGISYRHKGQLDDALSYYKKALEIHEELKDKVGMAADYNNIGTVYHDKGQLDDALSYDRKALEINEELKNKVEMAKNYNNIGLVYYSKGQIDDALGYYKKALEINEELKNKVGMAKNYNNIGLVYHDKGQIDDALSYYKKALEIDEALKKY
jgi:tetratricopeptide (TPR) repeat protein